MYPSNLLTASDSDLLCEILCGMSSYSPRNMGDILKHYEDRPEYIKVINKGYKDIVEYFEAINRNRD